MSASPEVTPPSAPLEPSLRELLGLILEDRRHNGGSFHLPGVQALVAYRVGRYRVTLGSGFAYQLVSTIYRLLQRRARNRFGIELHYTATIGRRVRIIHQSGIVIHNYAVIGDGCWIRQGVTLGSGANYSPEDRPTLGRDVQIGVGAVLVGAITVGDGARIGPNAVVLTDVAEGATVMPPHSRAMKL